jgi:hypothetical protein
MIMARVQYFDDTKTYGEITFDPPTADDVLDEYERLREDIGLRIPKLEKRLAQRRSLGGATVERTGSEDGEED